MRQFLLTVAGVVTGMLICALLIPLILVGVISSVWSPEPASLPRQIVLELDLTKPLSERPAEGFAAFNPQLRNLSVFDLVRGLEHAAGDERVKGVLLRVGEGAITPAQVEELHEALTPIRNAKKFIVTWAVSFNDLSLADYDAAVGADEIWLQPTGIFMPAGFAVETIFMKDFFEKIGAKGDFVALHEYKSAADMFMRNDFSEADRLQLDRLLNSIHETTLKRVAKARKLDEHELDNAFRKSPLAPEEAKAAGLIDRVAYEDELQADIRNRAGWDAKLVSLPDYVAGVSNWKNGEKFAVIFGEGMIFEGESDAGSLDTLSGGDTLSKAFREASEDADIKAIIFRINSPGGSATASDQIWRAVKIAREAGKPVIVSMGDVAASGGYYAAVGADYLLANRATITGSIGVVGGKFVIDDMAMKIGLHSRNVTVNDNALMWTPSRVFTPEERLKLVAMLSDIYNDFTARVAEGRNMSAAQIDAVARGRVWSGQDAKTHGLVDAYGGFRSALAVAREKAGLNAEAPVTLVQYPAARSLLEEFMGVADDFENVKASLALLSGLKNAGVLDLLSEQSSRAPRDRVLRAPALEVK